MDIEKNMNILILFYNNILQTLETLQTFNTVGFFLVTDEIDIEGILNLVIFIVLQQHFVQTKYL